MAVLNVLQSSFSGKVGEVIGAKWKNKHTVRAAVFSKAPSTNAQTQSVRAFEKLNRLSSAIARAGFAYLGLPSKNLHNHNAVARWLKPVVANNSFEPSNIEQVISTSDLAFLKGFTFNYSTGEMLIRLNLANDYTPTDGTKLFIVVFDDTGQSHYIYCNNANNFFTRFILHNSETLVYSVIAFLSIPQRRGFNKINFIYKRSAGMQYTFEEQLTGDLWHDGRPIYVRVFNPNHYQVAAPSTEYYLDTLPPKSQLVNSSISPVGTSWGGNDNVHGQVQQLITQGDPPSFLYPIINCQVTINYETGDMHLRILTSTQAGGFNINVITWYTKGSDEPVVDG